MHKLPIPVRSQDLQTLFRAREIIVRLETCELDAAIELARVALAAEKSRRQYLHEILPGGVAYAIPGETETFFAGCADGRCFPLQDRTLPLLWQILHLEQVHSVQVVKVIQDDGLRQWTYCL